jgi:hypothetical protein
MRLDAGKLIPLERESGTGVMTAVFSVKFSTMLPLGKSPVRFRANESLEFVVKASAVTAFGSVDLGGRRVIQRIKATIGNSFRRRWGTAVCSAPR